MKADVEDFKENPHFTEKHIDQRFLNINEKVQNLQKELSSTKEDVGIIQTTEPTWALEIRIIIVDLEDRSRRNNLGILGIKENSRKSLQECARKIFDLSSDKSSFILDKKLEMSIVLEKSRTIKKGQ